jgi:hypothetical protein
LKVVSERYLGDESARLRFLREARSAASVRHPNVASVFHLSRTGGNYFYAMEFAEGETLSELQEYRNTAYPGYSFYFHGVKNCVLNYAFAASGPASNVLTTHLVFDDGAARIFVNVFKANVQAAAVPPTKVCSESCQFHAIVQLGQQPAIGHSKPTFRQWQLRYGELSDDGRCEWLGANPTLIFTFPTNEVGKNVA